MLFLLSEHINLFRYISFRSMGAAVTGFLLVFLLGPCVISKLKEMRFGQQVREEGPAAHLSKTGTPTMGGILMWGGVIVSTLLWTSWNAFVFIILLTIVLFSAIGFIDDYFKIKQKDARGLSPKGKLFFQSLASFIVLFLIYLTPQYHQSSTDLTLELVNTQDEIIRTTNVTLTDSWDWAVNYPVGENESLYYLVSRQYNPDTGKLERNEYFSVPRIEGTQYFSSKVLKDDGHEVSSELKREEIDKDGNTSTQETKTIKTIHKAKLFNALFVPFYTEVLWFWPLIIAFLFYIFIIVGVSNAANLSDGLDGLATGMGISFYVPFGVFAYLMGHSILSSYLFYPYIPGVEELTIFIAAAIGAFSGFLWYNVHPAEVFMGDTGSLPMGAVIAVVAIMLKQELLLVVAGFMFVLETVSVILQVFWFKKYQKRLFKMAPIHHHFELLGWKENQVVVRFWIMSAFCAVIALASIKLR